MAFTFLSPHPVFLSLTGTTSSFSYKPVLLPFSPNSRTLTVAAGPARRNSYPNPADDDPPEAPEDSMHGVSKFQQIQRQAARARKLEEEDFEKNRNTYLSAIADVEDAAETGRDDEESGGDLFSDIDRAISMKRSEFVKQGLLKPNPPKTASLKKIGEEGNEEEGDVTDDVDELDEEEVVDLDEIDKLTGLTEISDEEDWVDEEGNTRINKKKEFGSDHQFEFDLDDFGESKARIVEPKFKMSLAELLDESKVVPISVYGDLDVEITGIQHDSRGVSAGDLFVCCLGSENFLSEADKRGAVAVVASKEIDIEDTLGCRALVIVEDTNAVLAALASSFYRHPSKNMSVIGVTGTDGKTTTTYLIKSLYEAMGVRTGMFSTVSCYIHGDNKLDTPNATMNPDAVLVQSLMAKMLHNGTESLVMEASPQELALGKCDEVDFDIAVFTNLTRENTDFRGTDEEYRDAEAKLFSRMVDPERHRKVVNIDDPNAAFFVQQGNPNVPVVTFAMENTKADVHPLKFELSLFETQVLVNTPQGILEISSGLLGRHNIYNILAAVAVGIAVGAPLEDIVRGVEEVDAVPGRCELIDEEQAFGVIVDHANTPDGLSRLLDSIRELKPRRIITVIGCEGENERGKRPLMTKIATEKSDVTMLTSDNPRNEDPLDILDDMLSGIGWTMQEYLKHGEHDYYPPLANGHRLFLHDIRRVAVRCAVAMGEEGDMVVVAGKGHEAYQLEGEKKEFYDDREECREALQYVDELHQAGIDTSEFPWRLPESH
ncbi:unnamed protein product [Arabidopsis thaliana]|uniref:UDP-N-acetylmuramoyl-L-alanyl-D-glutamate--2,6-diaminopimelate ligase MurE homolog, chloroplastic n=1 Tax=Arabidopsis thaliana TaxID=3702 RepID=A0A5S9WPA9_ARATH|nr:unnamed protein product [Arabidopsis thaliana]